jgi:hypothetical protein
VPWQWTNTHQSSFDKLRKMLTSDCVMAAMTLQLPPSYVSMLALLVWGLF